MADRRRHLKLGNPAWVKGVSGNPIGRPKGRDISLTKLLKEQLSEFPVVKGKKSELNWRQLLVQAWLRGAMSNAALLKEAVERIDGRMPFISDIAMQTNGIITHKHEVIVISGDTLREATAALMACGAIEVSANN